VRDGTAAGWAKGSRYWKPHSNVQRRRVSLVMNVPVFPDAAVDLYSFTGPEMVILLFGARKLVDIALPLVC
jgi:hypothetical protein